MRKILLTLSVFFSLTAASREFHEGTIAKIDPGTDSSEETQIYLSDGSVLKLPAHKDGTLGKALKAAHGDSKVIRVQVDDARWIQSVSYPDRSTEEAPPRAVTPLAYTPTVLGSDAEAAEIFRKLRPNARRSSQCYSRAHIWAYESKTSVDLDSQKVFLFFTRRYIREYNYEWWFHVAPYTFVKGADGTTRERVLDFRFTRRPTGMRDWTDLFMRNRATCPEIARYSEYEDNEGTNYCYLQKVSMYYFQPLDLDNLERTGREKNQWLGYEIRRAYRDGFNL